MQTADLTTNAKILSYFPEHIQAALRAYGSEINRSPQSVVQLAICYFLESADITVASNDQDSPNGLPGQSILVHLPNSMQKGIEHYAAEYEFPPEFVVELAVTFLLDPNASSFEDCQVNVQREQVHLLQQYLNDQRSEAA